MSQFNENMEEAVIILIVGMGIVFFSLILLSVIYHFVVPWVLSIKLKKAPQSTETKDTEIKKVYRSGEEMAAVAAAIYMFLEETHDEENAILTIGKSSKNYSPWSSKIYMTHHLSKR